MPIAGFLHPDFRLSAVLADYCGWLFPILEQVGELSLPRGKDRSNRDSDNVIDKFRFYLFVDRMMCYNGCKVRNRRMTCNKASAGQEDWRE